jgi:inosine triphosphate pyrophosphatase
MKKLAYVTGNREKFAEARIILNDFDLDQISLDLPEIQGDAHEIILHKAKFAQKLCSLPLIVEDVSVYCKALNGLPGPYVKDFTRTLGIDGLWRLIHKFQDHSATVTCLAAYSCPGKEPIIFEGSIEGTIVSPRGVASADLFSWNQIFQIKGSDRTFGEISLSEQSKISMRKTALEKIKAYLKGNAS